MECIEAKALKPSFRPENVSKSMTQQAFFDDLWCVNGINGVGGEDFSIDDLLDFSNGDFEDGSLEVDEEEPEQDENSNSTSFSGEIVSGSLPGDEIPVPVDDMASLEWLSHFVEDSFSQYSLQLSPDFKEKTRSEPDFTGPAFSSPVPVKPRTKRSRTHRRVWSLGSPSLTDSSSSSSGSSYSSPVCLANPVQFLETLNRIGEPPVKKQKIRRKPAVETNGLQSQRRCSHCQVQKTPQWRTGPLGPKTLCNACGVRFKSGRLFPEYRPACSPTFSMAIHSNSHRKVLEIRRKKEMNRVQSELTPLVY
ncbi:Zinc finger, GATA-type [Dillenia turbinata]|uniref:GATA transcription factor n=1 Tax=Dillenia turbinata TaxID=194707 RepID=A0AAN8UTS1_9MAGN